jgi:hypothetical protein
MMSRVFASAYKKSIYDIGLPREQEAVIWDFYVTKSIASSASQRRAISDYGWKNIPFKEMLSSAGILSNNVKILPATSINETLKKYNLDTGKVNDEKEIEIDELKIVCLTPFTIADENPPKAKVGDAESVLTHIRNAFAHGNTYFFDNGNVMLEDKNNGTVTARIIIRQQTLLDWIFIIDKEARYYVPIDVTEESDG